MERKRIVFSDVSFGYKDAFGSGTTALEVNNLCFEEGKCYVLTGPCGSGKTTLGLLLKGLIAPTSGSIALHESTETLPAFQNNIGFAFQFPEEQFFKETVEEEIAFGPTMLGHERISESIEKSLRAVGLRSRDFSQMSPLELSSGEKRRVAIASIIACRPSWYIFDEPTAGLDWEGRGFVRDLIEKLAEEGRTMIIITQELEIFARLCDEIIVLNQGKLLFASGWETFLGYGGDKVIEDFLPYHVRVLKELQKEGWDIPTPIVDPVEAAKWIAKKVQ
jgi:energy-coupling factor transport system ATP-binding protein